MAPRKIARPKLWELAEHLADIPDMVSYLYHDSELRPWTKRRTKRLFAFRKTCVKIPEGFAFVFYEPESAPGARHAKLFDIIPSLSVEDLVGAVCTAEWERIRTDVLAAEKERKDFIAKLSNNPSDTHFPHTVVDLVSNQFAYDVIDANAEEIGDKLARAISVVLRESRSLDSEVHLIYLFLDLLYFPRANKSSTAKLGWRHVPLVALLTMLTDASEQKLVFPLFPHAPRADRRLSRQAHAHAKLAAEVARALAEEMYGDIFDFAIEQTRISVQAQALDPKMSDEEPPVPRTYLNMLVRDFSELARWSPNYNKVVPDFSARSEPEFPLEMMLRTEWNRYAWSTVRYPQEFTVLRGADLKIWPVYQAAMQTVRQRSQDPLEALLTLPELELDKNWSSSGSYHSNSVLDGESDIYAMLLDRLVDRMDDTRLPVVAIKREFRGYAMLQAVLVCKASLDKPYTPAPGTREHAVFREEQRKDACEDAAVKSPSPLSASGASIDGVEPSVGVVESSEDDSSVPTFDSSAPPSDDSSAMSSTSSLSAQSVESPPRTMEPDIVAQSPLRIGFAAPGSVVSEPSSMDTDDSSSFKSVSMDVEPSRRFTPEEIERFISRERELKNEFIDMIDVLRPGEEPRAGWVRAPGTWTVYDYAGRPMDQWAGTQYERSV